MTGRAAGEGYRAHVAPQELRLLVAADWSARPGARAACAVDLRTRRLWRLAPPPGGWDVQPLLHVAGSLAADGSALVAIDAPLGVPASLLRALPLGAAHFLQWLPRALALPGFLEPVRHARDWQPARPFFQVPRGAGALTAFAQAARRHGVELRRAVEVATHAKPLFTQGIPGQVAPATRALWASLVAARAAHVAFAAWPFEGHLADLLRRPQCVVAEMYPRAAYGTALAATLPARPRALAKRNAAVRAEALAALVRCTWLRACGLRIEPAAVQAAGAGEDDFDALLTAAALARLVLEGQPLAKHADPLAEGGILCA